MSIDGRLSLRCLSKILQALWQYAPNVWSLLAQYLFIETSIMRDLLPNSTNPQHARSSSINVVASLVDARPTSPVDARPTSPVDARPTLLADYTGFLQMARRYDQQQQALRAQQEREAEERGEKAASPPITSHKGGIDETWRK